MFSVSLNKTRLYCPSWH